MEMQDLDNGLKALVETSSMHYEQPEELLKGKNPFDIRHKYLVFDKIYNDGFCNMRYAKQGEKEIKNMPTYSVNYNGIVFHNRGGYKRQRRRNQVKDFLQIANVVIVLIATIFATWYAGFEIWKYYYGYVPIPR